MEKICLYCSLLREEDKFMHNICYKCWMNWSGLFPKFIEKYGIPENELQFHIKEIKIYHKRCLTLYNYKKNNIYGKKKYPNK